MVGLVVVTCDVSVTHPQTSLLISVRIISTVGDDFLVAKIFFSLLGTGETKKKILDVSALINKKILGAKNELSTLAS